MVQDVHKQGSQWRSRFSLPPSLLPSFSPLLLLSPHPPSLTLSHFVCQYFVFQGHAQWSGEWQIAGETGLMVPSHSLFPLQPIPQPPKKHASGSPSHLCCTSSSHKCGGYKWRYENRVIQTTSDRNRRDGRAVDDDLDWCVTVDDLLSSSNWMPLQLSRWDKSFYNSDADVSGNKVISLPNRLQCAACTGTVVNPDYMNELSSSTK